MKPTATYPDVERAARDLLAALLPPHEPDVTVGVNLPTDWTIDSPEHVQVACDGTPVVTHPVVAHSTVRVTAWSASPTRAKHLANLSAGLLAAHDGSGEVARVGVLTGLLPARDPQTRAALASITLRVSVRSQPV